MSRSSSVCVAVIEDDESERRSLSRLLRAVGFQPVTYSSAESFLADAMRPPFDCLVLDLQLTGLSGIELNQQLAAAGSTVPVVFLTALDEPLLRDRALQTPCAAYLRKNEPGEALVAAIRQAIDRANHP